MDHALAESEGRNAQDHRFHGGGHGAGIGHVLAQIGTAIDPRQHQIGLFALDHGIDAQQHRVGGGAVHREPLRPVFAHAQGAANGQGMTRRRLLGFRGHHPYILGQFLGNAFQHLDAGGMNAVIGGNQDAGRGQIQAHGAMTVRPPI